MLVKRSDRIDYQDIGLCNCHRCEKELIGERTRVRLANTDECYWPIEVADGLKQGTLEWVFSRISGAPYCRSCHSIMTTDKAPRGPRPQVKPLVQEKNRIRVNFGYNGRRPSHLPQMSAREFYGNGNAPRNSYY